MTRSTGSYVTSLTLGEPVRAFVPYPRSSSIKAAVTTRFTSKQIPSPVTGPWD